VSLSASDYGDFTRIMTLYKLYYLLTYLLETDVEWRVSVGEKEPEIPCCDIKKTSTGSMRTLAASLYLLNCPEHPPGPPPPPADRPAPEIMNYDFSHRAKDPRLLKPWSRCDVKDQAKLSGCVSRGQMLVRFNEMQNAAGTPDLRQNTRTGKKHQFADNIHSQILRGSTIAAL